MSIRIERELVGPKKKKTFLWSGIVSIINYRVLLIIELRTAQKSKLNDCADSCVTS